MRARTNPLTSGLPAHRLGLRAGDSTLVLVTTALLALCPVRVWSEDFSANTVIQWNEAALQGVRDTKPGPPMVARALAIVHTCMYDAWAAYDEHALGTQLGAGLRRPPAEHGDDNQNKAISFAAYRSA